jgi:hypothetical protein
LSLATTFVGAQVGTRGCINGLSIVRKYLFAGGYCHTTILAPIGDRMLDGKRYYAAFPDENPERPIPHALLNALEKLRRSSASTSKNSASVRLAAPPMTPKKQTERAAISTD